jgi:small subunit ribosomal protein S1
VKILEIDSERRRLSLSIKRVEGQVLPVRPIEPPTGDLEEMPELGLSEDVFASSDAPAADASEVESSSEADSKASEEDPTPEADGEGAPTEEAPATPPEPQE